MLAWAGLFLPVLLTDGPSQKVEKKVGELLLFIVSWHDIRACVVSPSPALSQSDVC